jgi:hypothetical protein
LEIKNVRVEDEGFYVCSLSNNRNSEFKYAQAELIVLVKVTFLTRPIDQEVAEGNSVEFFCSANGKPEPQIIWLKDGLQIGHNIEQTKPLNIYEYYQNNQLLKINEVDSRRDDGVYTCKAQNQVNYVTTTAKLSVKRPGINIINHLFYFTVLIKITKIHF